MVCSNLSLIVRAASLSISTLVDGGGEGIWSSPTSIMPSDPLVLSLFIGFPLLLHLVYVFELLASKLNGFLGLVGNLTTGVYLNFF